MSGEDTTLINYYLCMYLIVNLMRSNYEFNSLLLVHNKRKENQERKSNFTYRQKHIDNVLLSCRNS